MKKVTESINNNSKNIDLVSTAEILKIINSEDKKVPFEVEKAIPQITTVVSKITDVINQRGRLFYVGAGTSGRLGVLDASECPPTYRVDANLVQGIIAGGDKALRNAVEGIEDNEEAGIKSIKNYGVTNNDAVIGLSASGSAAFVISALKYASELGAYTASITCNTDSKLAMQCDDNIEVIVGPEVVTGSTRMKAGTAQKLVLNMISTAVMIKIGKTYGNLMIDLQASNQKLRNRAIGMVMEITDVNYSEAVSVLEKSEWHVKTAIVMLLTNSNYKQAKKRLSDSNGFVRKALTMPVQ